jgi:hypothetical protein
VLRATTSYLVSAQYRVLLASKACSSAKFCCSTNRSCLCWGPGHWDACFICVLSVFHFLLNSVVDGIVINQKPSCIEAKGRPASAARTAKCLVACKCTNSQYTSVSVGVVQVLGTCCTILISPKIGAVGALAGGPQSINYLFLDGY